MRFTAILFAVLLCGCAAKRGFKVIDAKDAQRAAWAKPKATFEPSEPFLAHIRGYGGRKVTIELWQEPNQFCGKITREIPARKMYRSYEPLAFDTRYRDVELAEKETVYWTSTDYVVALKPQPPGIYELRLRSDDGRNETVRFTVTAYK